MSDEDRSKIAAWSEEKLAGQGTVTCHLCHRQIAKATAAKRVRFWFCATPALKRTCKAPPPSQ